MAEEEKPKPAKKSPAQKRAEAAKQREEWNEERIAEAFTAAGGTPKVQGEEPRSPGRPPLYPNIDLERVEMYAAGGLTKYEIAAAVGISETTRKEYENTYPAFAAAIARGRQLRLEQAEINLHKAGNGHYAPEEKLHYDSVVGKWMRETTLKYYPPDTKANLAILLHGETKSWKPKQEMDHHFPEPLILKSKSTGREIENLGLVEPEKK